MEKIYDLAVKTGTYITKSGEKGRYTNVGSVLDNGNGQFMVLNRTFNPAGVPNPENKDSVIISMFKPKSESKSSDNGLLSDDLIPF